MRPIGSGRRKDRRLGLKIVSSPGALARAAGPLTGGGLPCGPAAPRCAGVPLFRSSALPLFRSPALPLSRSSALPLSRSPALPLSRSSGLPVSRSSGAAMGSAPTRDPRRDDLPRGERIPSATGRARTRRAEHRSSSGRPSSGDGRAGIIAARASLPTGHRRSPRPPIRGASPGRTPRRPTREALVAPIPNHRGLRKPTLSRGLSNLGTYQST